jgi:hypothetical protein
VHAFERGQLGLDGKHQLSLDLLRRRAWHAGAILDRLTHQAHQLQLKGESMRKKISAKKSDLALVLLSKID